MGNMDFNYAIADEFYDGLSDYNHSSKMWNLFEYIVMISKTKNTLK